MNRVICLTLAFLLANAPSLVARETLYERNKDDAKCRGRRCEKVYRNRAKRKIFEQKKMSSPSWSTEEEDCPTCDRS